MAKEQKAPSPATIAAILEARSHYPMDDVQDFTDAERGRIAPLPGTVNGSDGHVIFDPEAQAFVHGEAPESVDASLWRQSQLIRNGGLFKVTDGLYQVRGNDIAQLTLVEGEDGVVVIDCMAGVESAQQGMELFRRHVSDKPVVAVIYTHTHIDHYGGVKGVVDAEDVRSGKVPIIAPGTIASFDKLAIGENVVAGNAMSRRAQYAFGGLLEPGPLGFVSCGIGVASTANPTVSYLSPTDSVTKTGERRTLAGIEFEFLYAPDTEAPEEMHIWIPQLKALTCAENANHTLHNVQTLRGARTRDARNFARYLDETLERWGSEAEVHYGPHTWPVWGNDAVTDMISSQRDTYKYIHDQALRLANQGYSPLEAAEEIRLPEQLNQRWFNHGYHGTVHHDVRAVFTKELGMWDGDPATLYPHPLPDSAQRYVDFMGRDAILAEGRRAVEQADYRWAVELLQKLVFADPEDAEARSLQAEAYEQLGYQSEGPQWRGVFLSAALELREGIRPVTFTTASEDTILGMPVSILFDFVAVHVDGQKAADADIRMNFDFTDEDEQWNAWIGRGVLNARRGHSSAAQLTVSGPKAALAGVLLQPAAAAKLADAGKVVLDGDASQLDALAALLDDFDPSFPIVTP